MEVVHPDLRPSAATDREAMLAQQARVRALARFTDERPVDERSLVAGVDQAFPDEAAVSAVVAVRDGIVQETVTARVPLTQPYVPGLLSYREGPSILAALDQLSSDPAVVLFDGSGRIHPREAGIATHVGVCLDVPAVGVAKGLLCGEPGEPTEGLDEGERVPIHADDSMTAPTGIIVGYAVQTRQYESPTRHINPLYVSPGHRMSAESAAALVETLVEGYKLPEPIRLADAVAGER